MTVPFPRLRTACRLIGLLAVLLALAGRLAAGMVVSEPGQGRAMVSLLDAMIQCQADGPAPPDLPRPPHHEADHALAALASLMDLPSPTLTPPAAVPLRFEVVLAPVFGIAPARAPPAHPPGAALPRGPPVLT